MVQYLASTISQPIEVQVSEVGTTLTISAPASVIQGEVFRVEGQLRREDTGALLDGENIAISYNGTPLVTAQTRDIEGAIKYQADVKIDVVGSFVLTADFAGSTRPGLLLGSSQAPMDLWIRGISASALILGVVVPILAGATLVYMGN